MESQLKIISISEVKSLQIDPVDTNARQQAYDIIEKVRTQGREGLIQIAIRLGDIENEKSKIYYDQKDLKVAYDSLDSDTQQLLSRTAKRIKSFAEKQRASLVDVKVDISGGSIGHSIAPVAIAGCYAPGGRYPLPSSVLMTCVTAKSAGVEKVYTCSPRPTQTTLGAAYIAEADGLLAIGGAQAIAAMAYGVEPLQACDVIVGPGNKWVTAAKSIVSGICAIDMLAGPSEVLVITDDSCNADLVAADLLSQAEHDVEARPLLVSTSIDVIHKINECIEKRLLDLSTASIAKQSITKGFAVLCDNIDEAIELSDIIAPEHLEIQTRNAVEVSKRCKNYGAVFIGELSGEVLSDYGAGPNHVLPTSRTSRYTGGLSVFTFLRIRTWMNINDKEESQELVKDCVKLARIEGLEAHARAAEGRLLSNDMNYDINVKRLKQ